MDTDEIMVVESTLIEAQYLEGVKTFLKVADERGHGAAAVVIDGAGRPLSHPNYADSEVVAAADGSRLAFIRHLRNEALGAIAGTDYIKTHAPDMAFRTGSPFDVVPHFADLLYVDAPVGPVPLPVPGGGHVGGCSWHPNGTTLALLERVAGRTAMRDGAVRVREVDLAASTSRLVVELRCEGSEVPSRLRYSPDGRYLLAFSSTRHFACLIDCRHQRAYRLPVRAHGLDWHPAAGPGVLIYARPLNQERKAADIVLYDAVRGVKEEIGRLSADRRLEFHELTVHPSGDYALAEAPVGCSAQVQEEVRGGLFGTAVLDLRDMSYEPLMSTAFSTPGAQRVHNRPAWRSRRPGPPPEFELHPDHAELETSTTPTELEDPTSPILAEWAAEGMGEIANCWASGSLAAPDRSLELLAAAVHSAHPHERLGAELARSPAPVAQEVGEYLRAGNPETTLADLTKLASQSFNAPASRLSSIVGTAAPGHAPVRLLPTAQEALSDLIAASTAQEAAEAAYRLRGALPPSGQHHPWPALLKVASGAGLEGKARIGLACFNWATVYVEQIPALVEEMPLAPPPLETQILRRGYEGSLQYDDWDAVVAHDGTETYTAGDVLVRCLDRLETLREIIEPFHDFDAPGESEGDANTSDADHGPPLEEPEQTEPLWGEDPFGRYHHRWWSGLRWTEHVSDHQGQTTDDPRQPARPRDRPLESLSTGLFRLLRYHPIVCADRRTMTDGERRVLVDESTFVVPPDPEHHTATVLQSALMLFDAVRSFETSADELFALMGLDLRRERNREPDDPGPDSMARIAIMTLLDPHDRFEYSPDVLTAPSVVAGNPRLLSDQMIWYTAAGIRLGRSRGTL